MEWRGRCDKRLLAEKVRWEMAAPPCGSLRFSAYFANSLGACAGAAYASAVVTHAHPKGIAGTIAVAVAAAMAWQLRDAPNWDFARKFFAEILRLTPEGKVRQGIPRASQTAFGTPPQEVARSLGNGSLVTAPDTVPFCLWVAANSSRIACGKQSERQSAWTATATQTPLLSEGLWH